MRSSLLLSAPIAAALTFAFAFAGFADRVAFAQETAAKGVFHGVGVVKAIDRTTGALTLDHEAIVGFMEAMEMMYRVEPRELSAGLHVGDRVAFDIDAERYAIVGVRVLNSAK
jgi:Cu/Ag efflux protein CusF